MDPFKEKHFVFVVSAGRTGTRFFGETLSDMIENTFSVHEPDVFAPRRGFSDFWNKMKTFGLYQLFWGKVFKTTGIRNLSQNYLAGKYSFEELQQRIISQRGKYYRQIDEQLIIESYYAWYGCIPAIRNLYRNYKIVVLLREPRHWATSVMNRWSMFGGLDWVTLSGLGRLTPALIKDEEYERKWKSFDKFQKICWTYKTQYEIMMKEIQGDENCIVVKFEDLFESEQRDQNLKSLLDFITTFDNTQFGYSVPDKILNKKIHSSKSFDFPAPQNWSQELNDQYTQICGNIAEELGYGE